MTLFERHPKKTLTGLFFLLFGLLVIGLEWIGSTFFGLGNPTLYQSHPIFGYRPIPHQNLTRFQGATLTFNNLGLRAETDWDERPEGKLLFLGDSVTYGGSYISNAELFSALVGQALHKTSGNAGVNAWGVNNVQALVQQTAFLPAQYYVSTFPEIDFSRGLNRFGGLPFWSRKPRWALEELYYYYLYRLINSKYEHPALPLTLEQNQAVIQQAVDQLRTLNDFLKAQGLVHLIFITPTQAQALKQAPCDPFLRSALEKAGLEPHYLADYIHPEIPAERIRSWYVDEVHLSKAGHQQWAQWMIPLLQQL